MIIIKSKTAAFAFSAVSALAVITLAERYRRRRKQKQLLSEKTSKRDHSKTKSSKKTRNGIPENVELPPHLTRELAKEERRQKMIPFLTMNRPMYDNVFMKDPEGTVLSTISMKKAKWYVSKDLAIWIIPPPAEEENDTNNMHNDDDDRDYEGDITNKDNKYPTIQLTFYPKNHDEKKDEDTKTKRETYNQAVKVNQCVVCGANEDGYMRHYIVPFMYRTRLPLRFKAHIPHDVVILCPDCSVYAGQESLKRTKELEWNLRLQYHASTTNTSNKSQIIAMADDSARPELSDSNLQQVKSAALALLRWKDKLPIDRLNHLTALLLDYYSSTGALSSSSSILLVDNNNSSSNSSNNNNTQDDEAKRKEEIDLFLTPERLQETANISYRAPNPNYISGTDLVIHHYLMAHDDQAKQNAAIDDFVRDCRQHFLDTMQPRYLPIGWSVDAPTQSDERKE